VRIANKICEDFLHFTADEFINWKKDKHQNASPLADASKRLLAFNQMLMHVTKVFGLKAVEPVEGTGTSGEASAVEAVAAEMRSVNAEDLSLLDQCVKGT
jgi:hypothetical protein